MININFPRPSSSTPFEFETSAPHQTQTGTPSSLPPPPSILGAKRPLRISLSVIPSVHSSIRPSEYNSYYQRSMKLIQIIGIFFCVYSFTFVRHSSLRPADITVICMLWLCRYVVRWEDDSYRPPLLPPPLPPILGSKRTLQKTLSVRLSVRCPIYLTAAHNVFEARVSTGCSENIARFLSMLRFSLQCPNRDEKESCSLRRYCTSVHFNACTITVDGFIILLADTTCS